MKPVYVLATVGLLLHSFAYGQNIMINNGYSKAAAVQKVMDRFTEKDLPGVGIAVYSEAEGWWASASGFSQIESKTKMTTASVHYLQSVSKTYLAVAILQLYEQNKISLDDAIGKYLPAKYVRILPNTESITIRMLLNHTSGLPEYNSHPRYTAKVLLNPQQPVTVDDMVTAITGEPMQFSPGSRYLYTNTNYLLLALIADRITGDHAAYIRKHILQPLQMNHSWYDPARMKVDYPGLTDSYWDILNMSRPTNITPMQKANVAPLMGDDGVVSTTTDAVLFLRGLMEGKLLKPSTLALMQQWVKNDSGRAAYGLGLIHFEEGGLEGVGHGGGGLGAGCILLYVPAKKIYLFLATNIGVVVDGLGGIKANELKNAVLEVLLKD
jgi:D-alanyl-D-alanine carboxypeptidase